MIYTVFFILTALAANKVYADPACPARDGEYPVYIPDDDCTRFWQCSNGVPYLQDCPNGLNFNPTLNVCDWPAQAGCEGSDSSSSSSESSESNEDDSVDASDENTGSGGDENGSANSGSDESSASSGSNETPECPARDGEESVYIPDEDCTKFWQCSNGVPYLQNCPDGLHFNPELNVCDWPDQAGCQSGSSSSSSSSSESRSNEKPEKPEEPESPGDETNSSSSSSESAGSGGDDSGSNESSECPAVDGDDSVYIPNEDCTKFWQCSNGVPYLQNCPAGLHFNPELNVCDWPDQAGCQGDSDSSSSSSSSESGSNEEPKKPEEPELPEDESNSSSSSSESAGSGGDDSGSNKSSECPAIDGEESVYIPDEDCTRFWQCSNGVPYLQNCSAGLHFNPELNVCDWPDQAGCEGSSSSSSSSSSSEENSGINEDGGVDGNNSSDDDGNSGGDNGSDKGSVEHSSSSEEDPDSSSESGENELECPSVDGQESVYIPHKDCSKFWQCSNGTPYLFDCPANLNFNPILNVCDWPEQAGCNGTG